MLPLNAAGGAASCGGLSLWGRGDYRDVDGDGWNGRVASASIGFDGRPRPDVLLGVALAYSDGAFDYDTADYANTLEGDGGYDITMTSVHPYLGLSLPHGISLWATVGYGEGDLEITNDAAGVLGLPPRTTRSVSDIDMSTVAVGVSSPLLQAGATTLRVKGEATHTIMETDDFAGTPLQDRLAGESSGRLESLQVDASRVRVGVEATRARSLADGAQLLPSLEAGMRYDDGGDGETGAGLELGGGVRYANPATGLSVAGKARMLVGRDDYDEWGVHGMVRLARGTDGQGLSFSLSPSYGDSGGGIQRLWRNGLPEDGDDNAADYRARLDARLGYGFPFALNGRDGMLILGATDRYRAGMNWKAGSRFDLTLLGECRESSGDAAEHAVLLKGEVRF